MKSFFPTLFCSSIINKTKQSNVMLIAYILCITQTIQAQTLTLPFSSLANLSADFTLSGGIPSGGTYKVDGIITTILKPSLLDGGTHTVSYTTGAGSVSQTFSITNGVSPTPSAANTIGTATNPATTLAATVSNTNIEIKGVYTINHTTVWNNCQVFASNTNAKIIVSPGKTLTINNGTRVFAFTSWKGIEVNATIASSSIFILDAKIEDAKTAITLNSSCNTTPSPFFAYIDCKASTFNRNNTCIKFNSFCNTNYSPLFTREIGGCTFDSKNSWTNQVSINKDNTWPTRGLEFLGDPIAIDRIDINGYYNANFPKNYFNNIVRSIVVKNGVLEIANIHIKGRDYVVNNNGNIADIEEGAGYYISNNAFLYLAYSTSGYTEKIEGPMRYGVYTEGAYIDLRNLELLNLGTGVQILNKPTTAPDLYINVSPTHVQFSKFTDVAIGINKINNNKFSYLSSNIFNNTSANYYGTAIQVENSLTGQTGVNVSRCGDIGYNTISGFKKGVVIKSLDYYCGQPGNCSLPNFTDTRIFNNNITLNTNATSNQPEGISVINSTGVSIFENNIYGNKVDNTSQWWSTGIKIENTHKLNLSCNSINNIGRPLFFGGYTTNINVGRNTLSNFDNGILWNYNYGFPDVPTNNFSKVTSNSFNTTFYNPATEPNESSTFAYYTRANNYLLNNSSSTVPAGYAGFGGANNIHAHAPIGVICIPSSGTPCAEPLNNSNITNNAVSTVCNNLLYRMHSGNNLSNINENLELTKIVGNDTIPDFDSLYSHLLDTNHSWGYYSLANKFHAIQNLHDASTNNPHFTSANVCNALFAYANKLKNSNVAKISNVKELLEVSMPTKNINSAEAKLNAMNKLNNIEQAYKTLYTIYLNTKAKGLVPNTNELSDVSQIANYCPYEYGDVVYQARALFGIDTLNTCEIPIEFNLSGSNNNKIISSSATKTANNSYVNVYPNPSNSTCTIEKKEEVNTVMVINYTGKIIHTQLLTEAKTALTFPNAGIYMLQFYNKQNQVLATKKHVVY